MRFPFRSVVLAVLVAAAAWPMFFPHLGEGSLAAYDEAVYAEIAREAHENGHYLVTWYHGRPYVEKPPLCIWAMAMSYKIFGVNELGARAPSALFAWLSVVLVFLLGKRCFNAAAGLLAAALLASSEFFLLNARQGMTDTLPVLSALLFAWGLLDVWEGRRWGGVWMGTALAAGFMSKYVIGLLPLGMLVGCAPRTGPPTRVSGARCAPYRTAGMVFFVLGLPWYAALAIVDWPRFSWLVFDYNLALRIESSQPPAPQYWLDLLASGNPNHPFTLIALPALLYLVSRRREHGARLTLAALLTYALFLLALKYPAQHFLVYLLPWLALAGGALLARSLSPPVELLPHAGLWLLLFGALARAGALQHLPLVAPSAWAALLATLFLALLFAPKRLPLRTSLAATLVVLSLLPALPRPPVVDLSPHMKTLGQHLNTLEPPVEAVFLDGLPPYGLQFYTRAQVQPFTTLEEARVPDATRARFLIAPRDAAAAFPAWAVNVNEARCLGPWALLPLLPSYPWIQPVDVECGPPGIAWILYDNGDLKEHAGRLLAAVHKRVVDMERVDDGAWILAADGTLSAYNAPEPPAGAVKLPPRQSPVDLELLREGSGFYVLGSGGAVVAAGGARYFGAPRDRPGRRFIHLVTTRSGGGYWIVDDEGRVETFGDAALDPDMREFHLPQHIARDAELRPGENRLLVVDGYGSLHGDRRDDPVQSPYYTGMEYVIDLEFQPDGRPMMLDTFGSVHGLTLPDGE
ncbi:glycosyltransferase family 39 protein [bacterium]|nr:glycosyltransferase family 39 protein [bacterium]